MVYLDNLDKNNLYVLSVLPLTKYKSYTTIIKFITKLVNHINNKSDKIIATHTAFLMHWNGKWALCEVSFNGRVHREFVFVKNSKYYITNLGYIKEGGKAKIINKYYKSDVKTIVYKIIATIYNYPIFKALGSWTSQQIVTATNTLDSNNAKSFILSRKTKTLLFQTFQFQLAVAYDPTFSIPSLGFSPGSSYLAFMRAT